jgi:hypothetical protein
MAPFSSLTLTLLVARVAADYVEPPAAANELAVLTNTLYAGTYFHNAPLADSAVQ